MRALTWRGETTIGEDYEVEEIPAELQAQAEEYREKLLETLSEADDEIMEKYLEGVELTEQEIKWGLRERTLKSEIVPMLGGSAFKNKGVQVMLDGVGYYLPTPTEVTNTAFNIDKNGEQEILECTDSKPLCSLAFKLEEGKYGQLTYIRVYQGKMAKGDTIVNTRTGKKAKIGRLVRMHASEMADIEYAGAGDIVALFGIDCASGDTFSAPEVNYSMRAMFVPKPVISYSVQPKNKTALTNFSKALNRFSKEDPTFRVERDEESGETVISGMGELHLDVYIERMRREYSVDTIVGEPQVAYRETISQEVPFMYIHKKQTGGSGQYAKIGGAMRPLVLQEGENIEYRFVDNVVGGKIPREYIPSCDHGFRQALDRGVLIGFPVVGVEMEVNDGAAHAVDSSDMAFQIAARAAFRETMPKAGPMILEPLMKVVVETPEEFQGTVQGTLIRRRGNIVGSEASGGISQIEAHIPLAEMFGYSTELRSCTQGKAEFTMEFSRYAPLPAALGEELIKKYREEQAKKAK